MMIKENQIDMFQFQVNGFKKKSITFLILVGISLILSIFGESLIIAFIAIIFIIFPVLYKKIGKISQWFLKFLIKHDRIRLLLGLIPGGNMKGTWMMEEIAQKKQLRTIKDLLYFFRDNWDLYIIIQPAFIALTIRAWFWIQGDKLAINLKNLNPNDTIFSIAGNGLIYGIFFLPIFLVLYFIIVYVWKDAEIKIQVYNKNITDNVKKIDSIYFLADPIKNILTLVVGISALVWLADKQQEIFNGVIGTSNYGGVIGAVIFIIVLFVLSSGIGVLMSVMYYRSGIHEALVNDLRKYIREESQKNPDYPIRIGKI